MDLRFGTGNVNNSLVLMLMGMVGIFVVMVIIMGLVALLNKVTDEKKVEARKAKREEKRARKAQLKDNMRSV